MSPDVQLECPWTSFRDVLRVNVTERVWNLGGGGELEKPPLAMCPDTLGITQKYI